MSEVEFNQILFFEIEDAAEKSFKKFKSSTTGQQVGICDMFHYHLASHAYKKGVELSKSRIAELEQQQHIVRARCVHYLKNESGPYDGWLAELQFIHSILSPPSKVKNDTGRN